jgi:hypothetical protein
LRFIVASPIATMLQSVNDPIRRKIYCQQESGS